MLVSAKYWVEDAGYAGADDLADNGVGSAHLAFVFELDFAADAGERGIDVADTRHYERFVMEKCAAFGVREDELHGADGETLRDTAALVDFLVFAGREGDLLDDLADVVGDFDVEAERVDQASCAVMAMPLFDVLRGSGCGSRCRCGL